MRKINTKDDLLKLVKSQKFEMDIIKYIRPNLNIDEQIRVFILKETIKRSILPSEELLKELIKEYKKSSSKRKFINSSEMNKLSNESIVLFMNDFKSLANKYNVDLPKTIYSKVEAELIKICNSGERL